MDGKIKISIDVMGGENSPDKTLEGISLFVKRYQNKDDYFFYLFGDVDQINKKIKKFSNLKSNYKIIDTKIVVADDLSALSAIKKGKNSSRRPLNAQGLSCKDENAIKGARLKTQVSRLKLEG